MSSRLFAAGIGAPEGPVCLPDGSMYVTEMSASTLCVTRLDPRGNRRVIQTTGGRPNGLTTDGHGRIWIAEAGLRALICLDERGNEIRRMQGEGADRFLFPNDLCFGPNGLLYMTDSGMAAEDFINGQAFVDAYMDLDWDGRVYEIDPAAMKVLRVLDRKIRFTNGIAFGPDNHLYANASFTGEIYRYDTMCSVKPRRNESSSATSFNLIQIRISKGRTEWPSARTVGFIARSTTRRTSRCWTSGVRSPIA
ncbi:SMP-30/gluconolactonase/LRE family protein [Bradyrhizobium sp. DASA03068]|uniref:SMP-30/gluconolactonase/LRE family protein n=1 Tax=Bradyrhizobium sp. BLXBL-01 TaxID=3395915 RepID=UPI003F6EB8FB